MKGGKLFYLLKQLNPDEFKDLKRAINSPFLNSQKRLVLLYKALQPAYPNYEDSEKYRQKLYKKVFPKEAYHKDKLHKLFSAFCRVTEEFILFSELRKDHFEIAKWSIHVYGKRQMRPFFEREITGLIHKLEAITYRDLEYYEAQIYLHKARYFNPSKDKYDVKDDSLDKLRDALDHYFALAKMRFDVSLKNRERILAKPGTWRFVKAIEEETDFMSESVLFQLYQQAFLMLNEAEVFSFDDYEKLLFGNIDQLRYDAKVLFFSGLNYVNRQVNRGISGFSKRALKWYYFGLEKKLLLENGNLTKVSFGNIVIYGCREKEFDRTKQFMETYASYLDANQREEVLAYNMGLWHFYRKEFQKVYLLFLNYSFSYEYSGQTRLTAIRALFELFLEDNAYYEVLISNIKSFENFIIRDKKYNKRKWKPHLNCIKIIRKLADFILGKKAKEEISGWLESELKKDKKIITKAWLMEKKEQINGLL